MSVNFFRSSLGYFNMYFAALLAIYCTEIQVSAIRCYTNNFNNWTALPSSNLTEVECGPLEQCGAIKYHVRQFVQIDLWNSLRSTSTDMFCICTGSTDLFPS